MAFLDGQGLTQALTNVKNWASNAFAPKPVITTSSITIGNVLIQ